MATNYNNSNYALNKNRKGIVYRNANGCTLEITFEKISATDPTFTQDDFEKLKVFSDEMYHEEEKSNCLYGKYIKGSYDNFEDSHWLQTESLEDELFKRADEKEFTDKIYTAISTLLTETQKRRLLLHSFRGLTIREIAKRESSTQKSVWESINAAQAKIKKFLLI